LRDLSSSTDKVAILFQTEVEKDFFAIKVPDCWGKRDRFELPIFGWWIPLSPVHKNNDDNSRVATTTTTTVTMTTPAATTTIIIVTTTTTVTRRQQQQQ